MIDEGVEAQLAQHGQVDRLDGHNRFDTAAQVTGELDDPQQTYVATGLKFADALTAGAVAGTKNAPVLLVTREILPGYTADELERIGPVAITVMGGPAVVGHSIEDELAGYLEN